MSATGRSSVREPRDFYRTPTECTEKIVEALAQDGIKIKGRSVLDAGCGDGAIGSYLSQIGAKVHGVELCPDLASRAKMDRVNVGDFLTLPIQSDFFDLIFMNPPFRQALPFVERALELMPNHVVALLRLSFLESRARFNFWQKHPADVYVLSRRPSFTGGRTDSAAYAWFVWTRSKQGASLRVI